MHAESKRVFVPNLPENLSEDDVRQRFFKFGDITSIEIKTRKDLTARNYSHTYAFININTTPNLLQQCFDEFSKKKWQGNYVEVQLAKESFLERLKKEREDAQMQEKGLDAKKPTVDIPKVDKLDKKIGKNKKIFDIHEEAEVAVVKKKTKIDKEELNVAKREKCSNIEMDTCVDPDLVVKNNKFKKISKKIEGAGLAPIHVPTEMKKKSKDPHREKADQKRINSMLQMKQGYMQQKSLIKSALTNIDGANNKKIIFDDNEDNGEEVAPEEGDAQKQPKLSLFEAGDEEDGDVEEPNFKIREEYEGKKGKKLFELQTRFNKDDRFKMDARFAENENSEDEQPEEKTDADPEKEREMLMQVLGEVLKKPMQSQNDFSRKTMTRFDPNQPEHAKYEMHAEKTSKTKKKDKRKDEKREHEDADTLPVVSADTFYQVSDKIPFQQSGGGETFSLLQAFGRPQDEDPVKDEVVVNAEKGSKPIRKTAANGENPFRYDSSDGEDEPEKQVNQPSNQGSGAAAYRRGGLLADTFFFRKDDYRLQEGVDFVKRMHATEDDGDFSQTRRDLKKIVKRKVSTYHKKQSAFKKKLGSKKFKKSKPRAK